jgi:hypothetical protein
MYITGFNHNNKVDTKPQARSNFDVTSFRRKQIFHNFIVGMDRPTDQPMDGVSYRGATSRLQKKQERNAFASFV